MDYRKELVYKTALMQLFNELFSENQYLMEIPESSDGIVAAVEFTENVTIYSDEMWTNLVKEIRDIDGLEISSEGNAITLKFNNKIKHSPLVDNLSLSFNYLQYSYKADEDFDIAEIDGMSREEAIDYLTESLDSNEITDVPNVDYICASLNSTSTDLNWEAALIPMPGTTDLQHFINQIKDTFRKIPEVLAREDEKLKAEDTKKQEDKQRLNEVTESLRPVLKEFGWEGQFCIEHFTKDIYKLYIRIGSVSLLSCRGNTDEIKSSIPKLIQLAHQYVALMSELGSNFSIDRGYRTKDLKWLDIL